MQNLEQQNMSNTATTSTASPATATTSMASYQSSSIVSTHDYVNGGINELVKLYYQRLMSKTPGQVQLKENPFQSLLFGIGILLGADIVKTVVHALIRENTAAIVSGIKWVLTPAMIWQGGVGLVAGAHSSCKSLYSNVAWMCRDFAGRFRAQPDAECSACVVASCYMNIEADDKFMTNLLLFMQHCRDRANWTEEYGNVEYTETRDNSIAISGTAMSETCLYSDIRMRYADMNMRFGPIKYVKNGDGQLSRVGLTVYDVMTMKYPGIDYEYKSFSVYVSHDFVNITVNIPCDTHVTITILKVIKSHRWIGWNLLHVLFSDKLDKLKNGSQTTTDAIVAYINYKTVGDKTVGDKSWLKDAQYKPAFAKIMAAALSKFTDARAAYKDPNDTIVDLAGGSSSGVKPATSQNKSTATSAATQLLIQITSATDPAQPYKTPHETIKKFAQFLETNSKRCNHNKLIKIYTIDVKTTIEETSKSNPKYEEYMEKVKARKAENADITEDEIREEFGPKPAVKITEKNVSKTVVTKLQCEKYAEFDNLYLRKQQDIHLYSLVETFQNDKEQTKRMGIPNKFGLLLHGKPGCGKSTTAITVASYLGYDLFYMNLSGVDSNDTFKLMVDYVNVTHTGGGVMLFEDIDAMTDVVKCRVKYPRVAPTTAKDKNTDTFTLEYLLNVLDGSITADNSVAIITTNYLEELDEAIYRRGRMDDVIELNLADSYQIGKIFARFIGRPLREDVLLRVTENTFIPADIIFHMKAVYKRRNMLSDEEIMAPFISGGGGNNTVV